MKDILKESEINQFINTYDHLISRIRQIAENETHLLNDMSQSFQQFYQESRRIAERLADIKSLPLEELKVKKLLLTSWLETAKNLSYMPDSHFDAIKNLAIDENNGAVPPSYAHADRKQGKMEKYYHVAFGVRWYYNSFQSAIESTLNFISEATKPYQTVKSLGQLEQKYDKEMENNLKEYLTTEEAAELMKTSTRTILRRIERGELKASQHGNGPYRIRRLDVELWLAGHS